MINSLPVAWPTHISRRWKQPNGVRSGPDERWKLIRSLAAAAHLWTTLAIKSRSRAAAAAAAAASAAETGIGCPPAGLVGRPFAVCTASASGTLEQSSPPRADVTTYDVDGPPARRVPLSRPYPPLATPPSLPALAARSSAVSRAFLSADLAINLRRRLRPFEALNHCSHACVHVCVCVCDHAQHIIITIWQRLMKPFQHFRICWCVVWCCVVWCSINQSIILIKVKLIKHMNKRHNRQNCDREKYTEKKDVLSC